MLEVVVAVGVFAIGIVAILALFAPAAKSVSANAEAEAAAAVAQALAADLQRRVVPADADPFAAITALLKKSTAAGGHELTADNARADYDIARDPQLLFANRDGTNVRRYDRVGYAQLQPGEIFRNRPHSQRDALASGRSRGRSAREP
ncbi:MAG: hypothetical protein NTZ29_17930 [Verrucomicrobia bacterium]|nr:hypothetical protein [Verrucomicrobiota bacterium]